MALDITTLLGSVSGGVLGFAGALIQQGMSIWQAREAHKQRLAELELAAKVDLQKADINLRQTQEDRAGEAFTESIKAQAGLTGESRRVRDVIALFRPGLTTLLVVAAVAQAFIVGGEAQQFFGLSLHNLATIAVGYWFGVRQMEKVNVTPAFPRK